MLQWFYWIQRFWLESLFMFQEVYIVKTKYESQIIIMVSFHVQVS